MTSKDNIKKAIEILEKVDPEISHQRKRAACIRHYKAGDELTPECRALLNERPNEEVVGQTTLGGDVAEPKKKGRPKKVPTYESVINDYVEEEIRLTALKGDTKYRKMNKLKEELGKTLFDMISATKNNGYHYNDREELSLVAHFESSIRSGHGYFSHQPEYSRLFDYPSTYKDSVRNKEYYLMNREGMKAILSVYPEYANLIKRTLSIALNKCQLDEDGVKTDYDGYNDTKTQYALKEVLGVLGFGSYAGIAPGFEMILNDLGIRRPDEHRWIESEYNDLEYTEQRFKEFVQSLDPNLLNTTDDTVSIYVGDIALRDAFIHHEFGKLKYKNGREAMVFDTNKLLKYHSVMGAHLRSVPYRIGYDTPFEKTQEELSDEDFLSGKLIRVADGVVQSKFDIQVVGNAYRERKCAHIISTLFVANLPSIFNGWEANITIGNYQSLNDSGKSIGASTLGSYSPHYDTLTVNTSIINDMDIFVAPREELQDWELEKIRKAHSEIVGTMFHEFAHQLDARMGNMRGKFKEKPIYSNEAIQALIVKCKEAGVKNDPAWHSLSATRNYPAGESWREKNTKETWGEEFFATTMESYIKNPHEFINNPTLQQVYKEIKNALGGWESPYLTKQEKQILHQKLGMIQ